MSFSSTVTLGVVGTSISAIKILSCGSDSECSGGDQILGYDNVTVSSFPLTVNNIPNNTQYIKLVPIGECSGTTQCLQISNIPGPSYTVTPTSSTVNEGGTVTFNVNTQYVINGTVVYWFVNKNNSSENEDFGNTGTGPMSGNVTIIDNTASFTVKIHEDHLTDGGPETFFIDLMSTNNSQATPIAISSNVTISDSSLTPVIVPTYSVTPQSSNVNEGASVLFNVTTTNVATGTILYWFVNTNNGASQIGDFVDINGQFTITDNASSFSVTLDTDSVSELSESFFVDIRTTNNQSASVAAYSTAVTINDKSVTYNVEPASYSVDEGSNLLFTVTTTNVVNNTVLYWTVNYNNNSTVSGDFSSISGSTTISGNTGTFSLTAVADSSTEGAQTFLMELRTDSVTGTIVDTTAPITINDTSLTPAPVNPPTYLFYSSAFYNGSAHDGLASDCVLYSTVNSGFTFFYNGNTPESFENHITRRINTIGAGQTTGDRIKKYTHDVCVDKSTTTYEINFAAVTGQSVKALTNIHALLAHPVSMGTITDIIDTGANLPSKPTPQGGKTSNTIGTFQIGGVNYRLYKLLSDGVSGSPTVNVKVTACS